MSEQTTEMANEAFAVLKDYERRSLVHAVGLPEQANAHWAWSGIAFRLAEANLVCEISDIVEILTFPDIAPVPGSKFWVMGISNVRGTLVPVVDLKGYLSGERSTVNKYSRVLVAPVAGGLVGLLIDEVAGQRHFLDEEESEDDHYAEHMTAPFIQHEFLKGEEYWGAFSFHTLVNHPDFLQAAA